MNHLIPKIFKDNYSLKVEKKKRDHGATMAKPTPTRSGSNANVTDRSALLTGVYDINGSNKTRHETSIEFG